MTNYEVQITHLHVADLAGFVTSERYHHLPVVPISPLRANSQAQNPRAQPDDVALVLAWSGSDLVGYLGAVPDWFYLDKKTPSRMAWLSCMWVSPAHRGKGIAKKLLYTMLEAWDNRVMLTEFTPEVKHLYNRTEALVESQPIPGFRGYLRPNLAQLLPPKRVFFKKIKPLLRLVDALLTPINALRLRLFYRQKMPFQIQVLQEIDDATADFIASQQTNELARRDRATLQWLLRHPWVQQTPAPDEISVRYHFTASARQFQTFALQMLGNGEQITGVLFFTLRDGHLRIPHAWHTDENTAAAARVIFAQAKQLGAKMLTVYHPRLVQFCQQNPTPFFWKRAVRRGYFIGSGLAGMLAKQPLTLQDGDGDGGFT